MRAALIETAIFLLPPCVCSADCRFVPSTSRPRTGVGRVSPLTVARRAHSSVALLVCAGVATLALSLPAIAWAQNKPGVPGGILSDSFRFNEHPQMQFATSAPDPKFQHGPPDERRRADRGDPSGDACNLKCGQ